MATLKELAEKLEKKTVVVRGVEMQARALSDAEVERLQRMFPPPVAPAGHNPNAGSNARPVPQTWNADYRREHELWFARQRAIEACVAIDLAGPNGPPSLMWRRTDADIKPLLEELVAAARETLTPMELDAIYEASVTATRDRGREAMESLIVAEAKVTPGMLAEKVEVPANFCTTKAYARLRIAERFGWSLDYVDQLGEGTLLVLRQYEQARAKESGGLSGLGGG